MMTKKIMENLVIENNVEWEKEWKKKAKKMKEVIHIEFNMDDDKKCK